MSASERFLHFQTDSNIICSLAFPLFVHNVFMLAVFRARDWLKVSFELKCLFGRLQKCVMNWKAWMRANTGSGCAGAGEFCRPRASVCACECLSISLGRL